MNVGHQMRKVRRVRHLDAAERTLEQRPGSLIRLVDGLGIRVEEVGEVPTWGFQT